MLELFKIHQNGLSCYRFFIVNISGDILPFFGKFSYNFALLFDVSL